MRKGYKSELVYDDRNFIGVCLGSDFVSEHEWGIDGIKNTFGIVNGVGIERMKIHKGFDKIRFEKWGEFAVISTDSSWEQFKHCTDDLTCVWDENDFAIISKDEKSLTELWDAFKIGDICILLGGGGGFSNRGLLILITSKVPQEIKDVWKNTDEDNIALNNESKKIGIDKKLKKAGKNYYALTPNWAKDFKNVKSKWSVLYWLNPMEQQQNNYGWVTVEDLELWIENKGPIPKKD